jgi:hypothetical protein
MKERSVYDYACEERERVNANDCTTHCYTVLDTSDEREGNDNGEGQDQIGSEYQRSLHMPFSTLKDQQMRTNTCKGCRYQNGY